jgi:hypothetical protein
MRASQIARIGKFNVDALDKEEREIRYIARGGLYLG